MAYDEGAAQRVREHFTGRDGIAEKKMFGGLAFMLRGHMCCGLVDDTLMARVGPANYAATLQRPHARAMDFTGKPMRGFVYVAPAGFATDAALHDWLALCERFVATLPPK